MCVRNFMPIYIIDVSLKTTNIKVKVAIEEKSGEPQSQWDFSRMSVQNYTAMHQIVLKMCQYGPKW